jgi:hypothetical protein
MKLFTKEIEKKLQAQYPKGPYMDKQDVVVKIFNPYGRGTWYVMNQDPDDPDYLWGIVKLHEVEVGSFLKSDLEKLTIGPGWHLERDLSFRPTNALEVYKGLREGKHYEKGGDLWLQEAESEMEREGTKGAFTKKAKRHGMTPVKYAKKVLSNPDEHTEKTRKQAQFVKNANPELFEKGGVTTSSDRVYIDYRNKDKGYATDRKYFNSFEDAEKWAKKEFESFNPDMIHYEMGDGGEVLSMKNWFNKNKEDLMEGFMEQKMEAEYEGQQGQDLGEFLRYYYQMYKVKESGGSEPILEKGGLTKKPRIYKYADEYFTTKELIERANVESYYERLDEDIPEMTTIEEAVKYLDISPDEPIRAIQDWVEDFNDFIGELTGGGKLEDGGELLIFKGFYPQRGNILKGTLFPL